MRKQGGRFAAVLLGCACALTIWSGAANACGPGKRHKYLVASGTSLHGVNWRITAHRAGRGESQYVGVEFRTIGYPESGLGAGLPWPLHIPPSFFIAIGGSYTDPPPESDLAGFTGKRVALIAVSMETGETVNIYPQFPPAEAALPDLLDAANPFLRHIFRGRPRSGDGDRVRRRRWRTGLEESEPRRVLQASRSHNPVRPVRSLLTVPHQAREVLSRYDERSAHFEVLLEPQ